MWSKMGQSRGQQERDSSPATHSNGAPLRAITAEGDTVIVTASLADSKIGTTVASPSYKVGLPGYPVVMRVLARCPQPQTWQECVPKHCRPNFWHSHLWIVIAMDADCLGQSSGVLSPSGTFRATRSATVGTSFGATGTDWQILNAIELPLVTRGAVRIW